MFGALERVVKAARIIFVHGIAASTLIFGIAYPAGAQVLNYAFSNQSFTDGSTLNGTMTVDFNASTVTSANLIISGSSPTSYSQANVSVNLTNNTNVVCGQARNYYEVKFSRGNGDNLSLDFVKTNTTALVPGNTGFFTSYHPAGQGNDYPLNAGCAVFNSLPTVSSASPSGGKTSGGNAVVITGSNFSNGTTTVSFGGTSASFVVNSDAQITATAPAHSAGTFDISITNSAGTGTGGSLYTYVSTPAVTTASLPNGTYGASYSSTTLTASGGTPSYSFTATGLPTGLTLSSAGVLSGTPTQTGTFNVTVTARDSTSGAYGGPYTSAAQALTLTVVAAPQTITFNALSAQTYAPGLTVPLTATASSALPVAFTSTTPGACTVSGTTATILTAGACSITASQGGNSSYLAAPSVSQALAINQSGQTISFTQPINQTFAPGLQVPLTVSATSLLPITLASTTTSVCTIAGTKAVILTVGTCTIEASQPGDGNYTAASNVTRSFSIGQAASSTTVTFAPNPAFIGQSVTFSVTTASSGGAPTGIVTVLDGSTAMCSVTLANSTGTCTAKFSTGGTHNITAAYSGNTTVSGSTSPVVAGAVTDQTTKTVQAVGRFVSQRSNHVMANQPDQQREVDRLIENETGLASAASSAGFANDPTRALSALGMNRESGDTPRSRNAGRIGNQRDVFGMSAPRGNHDDNTGGLSGPFKLSGDTDGVSRFSFATSMREIARFAAESDNRKQGSIDFRGFGLSGQQVTSKGAAVNPFDIWIEGKVTSFRDRRASNDIDGHFGLVSVGADYVVSKGLLVGAVAQFDSMRQRSASAGSEVAGNGWMVGPYATVRLSPNLFWQGKALWGRSVNDVSPFMTYVDRFASTRWLTMSSLTGRWQQGAWTFKPSASLTYMQDTSEAYVDTYGVAMPGLRNRLGQLKAGPEVAYRFDAINGIMLEPHASAQVIWNFAAGTSMVDGNVDYATLTGDQSGPGGARGRVELGVKAGIAGGARLDVGGAYDGIGSNGFSAITGRATVRVPLN